MSGTYLATPVVTVTTTHSTSTVTASTVTVTAVNSVKVITSPQIQTAKVVATIGVPGGTPNVIIASKRARLNSKDKDMGLRRPGSTEIATPLGTVIVRKEVSLDADLRNMMHAFGDSCNPLDDSVRLMEQILKLELQGFVIICESVAALCGSKTLGLLEPIYTIRNEKSRLIRLLKYFAMKDQQIKLQRMNQIPQAILPPPKLYMEEIRTILEKLDESGEYSRLVDPDYIIEPTKTEKALRADKVSQRINHPKYLTYSKARSVSFARKSGIIQEWVQQNTRSEFKMGQNFIEVLSFLAYEIVSYMVDLAFIIRRERVPTTNPIMRIMDTRVTNPETCMSAPAFQKRKEDPCNSVSEILVQASELEAKRLKKVTTPHKEIHLPKSLLALTVGEIGEAYSRFQGCLPPSLSYKVRAERIRQLNYQY